MCYVPDKFYNIDKKKKVTIDTICEETFENGPRLVTVMWNQNGPHGHCHMTPKWPCMVTVIWHQNGPTWSLSYDTKMAPMVTVIWHQNGPHGHCHMTPKWPHMVTVIWHQNGPTWSLSYDTKMAPHGHCHMTPKWPPMVTVIWHQNDPTWSLSCETKMAPMVTVIWHQNGPTWSLSYDTKMAPRGHCHMTPKWPNSCVYSFIPQARVPLKLNVINKNMHIGMRNTARQSCLSAWMITPQVLPKRTHLHSICTKSILGVKIWSLCVVHK